MSAPQTPGGEDAKHRRSRWQPPASPGGPKQSQVPEKERLPKSPPKPSASLPARPSESPGAPPSSPRVGGSPRAPGPGVKSGERRQVARTRRAADSPTPPVRIGTLARPAGTAPPRSWTGGRRPFLARGTSSGPRILSRGERGLFWFLLAAVLAMSIFLVRYRERVTAHFNAAAAIVPLAEAASPAPVAPLALELADDDTGAIDSRPISFPMPADPNTRAQVVLEKLLDVYAQPGSAHYIPPGPPGAPSVNAVYLAPLPGHRGTLAVVDLAGGFARRQPSGIEPETLTLLSMIATLHANLPEVTEVHFLVDGEPQPTLAGHADLGQTYVAGPLLPSQAFQSRP